MATKPEITAVLTMLEEVCVRKEPLSSVGLLAYIKMLEDIPSDLLQAAALECAAKDKWFPTPADLRAAAASLVSENIPDGMTAWGEVKRALSLPKERIIYCADYEKLRPEPGAPGYMQKIAEMSNHTEKCQKCRREVVVPQISPAAKLVADGMGWDYLRASEDEMADRAHFLKAYEQVVARKKHDAVQLPQVKALAESKKMQLGSGA